MSRGFLGTHRSMPALSEYRFSNVIDLHSSGTETNAKYHPIGKSWNATLENLSGRNEMLLYKIYQKVSELLLCKKSLVQLKLRLDQLSTPSGVEIGVIQ